MENTKQKKADVRYNIRLKTITLKVKEPEAYSNVSIVTASKAYDILFAIYKNLDDDQEHFTVLFLDRSNHINGYKVLFSGGKGSSIVDLTILYRNVLLFGASHIIVAHNHPAGVLAPSKEDFLITNQICKAGKLLDVKVLDHLILSKKSFYSFQKHHDCGF